MDSHHKKENVKINVSYSACIWPTALKLGCITNFELYFLHKVCSANTSIVQLCCVK